MQSQMTLWSLISQASIIVQMVMLLLVAMFLITIFITWKKWFFLKLAQHDTIKFEKLFWSGIDVNQLSQNALKRGRDCSGLENIFLTSFQEFLRLKSYEFYQPEFVVASVKRAMEATVQKELMDLERSLNWLATTGSIAPYLGLFGTVIGVMNSFRSLGAMNQVTLSHVAPGIAEALIATAIGLLVAIPAVAAYNKFTNEVNNILSRYDVFIDEFANILARQYVQLTTK